MEHKLLFVVNDVRFLYDACFAIKKKKGVLNVFLLGDAYLF